MSEWREIASAPRDETEFQAWCQRDDGTSEGSGWWEPRCRFNEDTEAFEVWGRIDYDMDGWDSWGVYATHWMPLPNPPTKD